MQRQDEEGTRPAGRTRTSITPGRSGPRPRAAPALEAYMPHPPEKDMLKPAGAPGLGPPPPVRKRSCAERSAPRASCAGRLRGLDGRSLGVAGVLELLALARRERRRVHQREDAGRREVQRVARGPAPGAGPRGSGPARSSPGRRSGSIGAPPIPTQPTRPRCSGPAMVGQEAAGGGHARLRLAGAGFGRRPGYRAHAEALGAALDRRGLGLVTGGAAGGLMGAVADAAAPPAARRWACSRGARGAGAAPPGADAAARRGQPGGAEGAEGADGRGGRRLRRPPRRAGHARRAGRGAGLGPPGTPHQAAGPARHWRASTTRS